MIWKLRDCVSNEKEMDNIACLVGHKGAVFGIEVDWNDKRMVTVGDDRDVIVWHRNIDNIWNIQYILHGHDARIWGCRSISSNKVIITWGEDCSIKIWQENKLITTMNRHNGRNIWCGDVKQINNDEIQVITGGNDSGVILSHVTINSNNIKLIDQRSIKLENQLDYPRKLLYLNNNNYLIVTDCGEILFNKDRNELDKVICDGIENILIDNYCVLLYIERLKLVLFGTSDGRVIICENNLVDEGKLVYLQTIELNTIGGGENKVMNLISNDNGHVICISLSNSFVILVEYDEIVGKYKFIGGDSDNCALDISEYCRWIYCGCIRRIRETGNIEILAGDRNGYITYLTVDNMGGGKVNWKSRVTRSQNIGVTCLLWDKYSDNVVYVGTKNGQILQYSYTEQVLKWERVILFNTAVLGWIKCMYWGGVDASRQIVIEGFKSVMYRRVRLLLEQGVEHVIEIEYECGGGHREVITNKLERLQLIYIQQRQINEVNWTTASESSIVPVILHPYLHGREINTCLGLPTNANVIITGSEDCSICTICGIDKEDNINVTKYSNTHISSVRCMEYWKHHEYGQCDFLISAGGRGQVVLWYINSNSALNHNISLQLYTTIQISSVTNTDIRIMDITTTKQSIFLAASSGHLIQLKLINNGSHGKLKLIRRISVCKSCITECITVANDDNNVVCVSSDGNLYYCMNVIDNDVEYENFETSIKRVYVAKTSLHGIDVCSSFDGNNQVNLVSIGGDDGGVRCATINNADNNDISITELESFHHSGSCVSTKWLPKQPLKFISLGTDNRILLWQHTHESFLILSQIISYNIGVPDPHSMSLISTTSDENLEIFIVGMGAKLIKYKL